MRANAAIFCLLLLGACQAKPAADKTAAPPAAAAPATTLAAANPAEGLPPGHPNIAPAPASAAPVNPAESISGTITAAPAVASKLGAKEIVFVIGRDPKTQQVLAVRKEEGASFPFAFSLSSADAMTDGQNTTWKGPLDITARVSKSGDAIAKTGDIEGVVKGVTLGQRGVAITLDSVRP